MASVEKWKRVRIKNSYNLYYTHGRTILELREFTTTYNTHDYEYEKCECHGNTRYTIGL